MDQIKTGKMIRFFRTEMNLTQKQLADRIHVSDKAISKWELGNGCPDISLLAALADFFGTDIQVLLSGEIDKKESEKGNMKKTKFYVCKDCGNIVTALTGSVITCCGNKLSALEAREAEKNEQLNIEETPDEWFITSDHSMTKEHYISFAAFVTDRSFTVFKQYPEWNLQLSLPRFRKGRLVWYCTQCGLLYQNL